jgi:hypothetical protein
MLTTILCLVFRLLSPTCDPSAAADHSPADPWDRTTTRYSVTDWQSDVESKLVCQCLVLKVSPEGSTLGASRPCSCDE